MVNEQSPTVTRLIIRYSTSGLALINQGMDKVQRKVLKGGRLRVSEAREESDRDWLAGCKVREVRFITVHTT